MYCPACGNDVGDASFCPYCGTDMAGCRDPWGMNGSEKKTSPKSQASDRTRYCLAFLGAFAVSALLGFFIGIFVIFITGAFFIGATGGATRRRKTLYYIMLGLIVGTAAGYIAGFVLFYR